MKLVVTFILLIAGINAMYQQPANAERNIITSLVIEAVEDVSQSIQDAGLDPLYIEFLEGAIQVPVPDLPPLPRLLTATGYCSEVRSNGLSYIIFNHIRYSVLGFRLEFEIEFPHIHFSVEEALGSITLFDDHVWAKTSGSIDIRRVKLNCAAHVRVLDTIHIRHLEVDFDLGTIHPNINLTIMNVDVSDFVNTFIGQTIPDVFKAYQREINELIAIYLMEYINSMLPNV